MDVLEQIREEILRGHVQETGNLVRKALQENIEVDDIVDLAMLPAMKKVGETIATDCIDMPHLLSAARSVRMGFETIEKECGEYKKKSIGTVILGTVEGDLHDVGKNLVALMMRTEGFEVIDLGVDITEKQFVKAIREHPDVSIVCISSLLTTSLPEMTRLVKKLKSIPKRNFKIMVGGGAVTEEIALQIGADAYTENAVDAALHAKDMMEK